MTNKTTDFTKHGPKMHKNKYEIIPIKAGTKRPATGKDDAGWRTGEITKEKLNQWATIEGAGVGVRAAITPAVDVDVYDKDVSDKLRAFLLEKLDGKVIIRVGQAPKFLIPFRIESPRRKRMSTAYVDMFGDVHRIEVLGDGQYYITNHTHPDTKKPFTYETEHDFTNTKVEELPLLTDELIDELFEFFDKIRPDDWEVKKKRSDAGLGGDQSALASIEPRLPLGEEEVIDIINQLDNEDLEYDDWVSVGMGLHHQCQGSQEGFDLWSEWSQKSGKHNPELMEKKWDSFGEQYGRPVTFATVMKMYNEQAADELKQETSGGVEVEVPAEGDDLGDFLKRYAFLVHENAVVDVKRPVDTSVIKLETFKNLTANKLMEVKAPIASDPDRTKWVPIHSRWLTHSDRIDLETKLYDPSQQQRFVRSDDGRRHMNTAHRPDFTELAEEAIANGASLKVFSDHIDYLVPDPVEREWFMGWLAFQIQRPEPRCKVTPLHYSVPHGSGRGWVVELLEALLGDWNVTKTKMEHLAGEKSEFNEYLNESLLCAIEEVKESDQRYSISDKVRDILTENRLNVNTKYGGKRTQNVYTNFFFQTNHADALVIDPMDRRIYVINGPDFLHPDEYYRQLYQWKKDKYNLALLWKYLNEYNLAGFNWQRAPLTAAKETMMKASRSDLDSVFREWQKSTLNSGHHYMTRAHAISQLTALASAEGLGNFDRQLNAVLKKALTSVKRKRIKALQDITTNAVRIYFLAGGTPTDNDKEIEVSVIAVKNGENIKNL